MPFVKLTSLLNKLGYPGQWMAEEELFVVPFAEGGSVTLWLLRLLTFQVTGQ